MASPSTFGSIDEVDGVGILLLLGDQADEPSVPRAQLLLVARVGQGEHRLRVADGLEALRGRGADALAGGVGGEEVGVLGLERAQLVHEPVVLGVGDLGGVLGVVEAVVVLEQPAQLAHAVGGGPRAGHRPAYSISCTAGRRSESRSKSPRASMPAS